MTGAGGKKEHGVKVVSGTLNLTLEGKEGVGSVEQKEVFWVPKGP